MAILIFGHTTGTGSGGTIGNATYDSEYNINLTFPTGLDFKSDGTRMYVNLTDETHQFDLSTPWDVSTASTAGSTAQGLSTDTIEAYGVTLSADGTQLYVADKDPTGGDKIAQFNLTTAYAPANGMTHVASYNTSAQVDSGVGMHIGDSGNKFYALDYGNDNIFQYNAGTPWTVSTLSYASKFGDIVTQASVAQAMYVTPDGMTLLVGDTNTNAIYEYNFGTAWDISTISYSGFSVDISNETTNVYGVRLNTAKDKMFVLGWVGASSRVFEYTL